jgi:hypothetical protein
MNSLFIREFRNDGLRELDRRFELVWIVNVHKNLQFECKVHCIHYLRKAHGEPITLARDTISGICRESHDRFAGCLAPFQAGGQKMIKIEEPALALNDMRVGGHIGLSRSIRIRNDDARANIVGCVATLAARAPGGYLKSLVLNSHGAPGYLIMGEGFWHPHTAMFERWAGLVSNIWITACRIASRTPLGPRERLPRELKGQVGDGFLFCRSMAMRARCNVIASMNDQDVPNRKIPKGCIDSFEGTVLCFKPSGDVAWAHRYLMHSGE